jgi:sulfite reductase alpha subunit-like flavoprotein
VKFFQLAGAGRFIYICGDALRMVADADSTIREVIELFGSLEDAGVDAYMDKLVVEHRYQRGGLEAMDEA